MDASFRLGALDASHRDRVAAIVRETGVFREEEVAVALEVFDEGIAGGPDADYQLLGIFTARNRALAGFAAFGPTPNTDRTYDLYWIAVDPVAQGTGAGSLLLNGVESALRDRDARMVVVETSSRSEYDGTRRFYARRGYAEVARMREFYAPGDDRVIYTKRVAAPVSGHGVANE